jgi:hypothetical protein
VLFNAQVGDPGPRWYHIELLGDDTILLQAGQAEGIQKGASFCIFTEKNLADTRICKLKVEGVGYNDSAFIKPEASVYSLLRGKYETPSKLWALMSDAGPSPGVAIYLPPVQDFNPIRQKLRDRPAYEVKIHLVAKEEGPYELAVFKDGDDKCRYELKNKEWVDWVAKNRNGLAPLPDSTTLSVHAVYPDLSAAANFFFHLRRTNELKPLDGHISVSVYKLKTGYIAGARALKPDGEDLNVGGTVRIEIPKNTKSELKSTHKEPLYASDAKYGLKVKSTYDKPLYVLVFMFNMSDLSICTSSSSSCTKGIYAVV